MKAILLILLVAVGWFSFMQINKAKSEAITAKVELKAVKAALTAELSKTQNNLRTAETDIERLRRDVTDAKVSAAAAEAIGAAPHRAPVPVPAPAPPIGPSADEVSARLAELRVIYTRNHQDLTLQWAKLTENLSKAHLLKKGLESSSPKFTELRTRKNANESTSNVGVKMSQVDRNLAVEKHQLKVDQMSAQIAAIEGEMVALGGRFKALDRSYDGAVARATGGQ